MAITNEEIFKTMFSGLGTNIGINLSNHQGDITTLLKTELPPEHQQTIKKIAEGILERQDYTFIPLPGTTQQQEFSQTWKQAYTTTLEEYKKLTTELFNTLTQGSTFEQETITNRLEYKRAIQTIAELQSINYKKEIKGFQRRFNKFEQNESNKRQLEEMTINMNLHYRIPKESKACPIDAYAIRIKDPKRIAEKIARKWIMLLDKIETAKIEGKPFNAKYDELLITDIFGLLMLQNKNKQLNDGVIYASGKIKTIEDSEKKKVQPTSKKHRTKGQRQVKLLNTRNGIILDYHLFRTLDDWIDNEFSREKIEGNIEIIPHEEYTKEKLRKTLKKNDKYKKIYEEITSRTLILLNTCINENLTETIHQKYERITPDKKTRFLEEEKTKLEKKLEEIKRASKTEKRKKVGLITTHQALTEIIKCYTEEIRKPINQPPETCNSTEYARIREYTVKTVEMIKDLRKKFEETTKQKYDTKELVELVNSYTLIGKVCTLNNEIQNRYDTLKTQEFKEKETLDTIKYYTNLLEKTKTEQSEELTHPLTRYNIYLYLINTQQLLLNTSPKPESYAEKGITKKELTKLIEEFVTFTEQNTQKLGNKRVETAYKILID